MAGTPIQDFTDVDDSVARDRLLRLHQANFSTFDPSRLSTDRTFFEEMATVWERYAFYINRLRQEGSVRTATERQSLLDLGKVFGFTPSSRAAAVADLQVTITRSVVPGAPFTFQAGQQILTRSTGDPVTYETTDDLTFPADGSTTQVDVVPAENSVSAEDQKISDDTPAQLFRLSQRPFLDGSLQLSDDLGVYEVRPSFGETGPNDEHVILDVDSRERTTIAFGGFTVDDVQVGRIPSGTIVARYRIGGGRFGSVEEDALTVLPSAQFFDGDGNPVVVTVTNPAASSPGADRQTIPELRREIPLAAQSLTRTVSKSDFENNAVTLVASVARALALAQTQAAFVPLNDSWVYIVQKGGGVPPQATLDEVEAIYADTGSRPANNTVVSRAFAAPLVLVAITTRIFVASGSTRAEARASIAANLTAYFDPENLVLGADGVERPTVSFGFDFAEATGQPDGQLSWAKVLCLIDESANVAGVDSDAADRLLLNGQDGDIALELQEFPALDIDNLIVIDSATGTPIPPPD